MSVHISPETVYRDIKKEMEWVQSGVYFPIGASSNFTCPHCNTVAQQLWGTASQLVVFPTTSSQATRYTELIHPIVLARCMSCNNETVFRDGKVIVPQSSAAPLPIDDLPVSLVADYLEARAILSSSPRGAAALLRLLIQKLLPYLGATKSDINAAIGELVAAGRIPSALQKALDTVRVIGNEAVHPGSLDLNDTPDLALSMFNLVNIIVEKGISEPKAIEALFSSLPTGKLSGIEQRDKR